MVTTPPIYLITVFPGDIQKQNTAMRMLRIACPPWEVHPPTGKTVDLWGASPTRRLATDQWPLETVGLGRSVPFHRLDRETILTTLPPISRLLILLTRARPSQSLCDFLEPCLRVGCSRGAIQFHISITWVKQCRPLRYKRITTGVNIIHSISSLHFS